MSEVEGSGVDGGRVGLVKGGGCVLLSHAQAFVVEAILVQGDEL